MVFLLGRFFARSTTRTSVPICGPSTVMSEKMPAVCIPLSGWVFALEAILSVVVARLPAVSEHRVRSEGRRPGIVYSDNLVFVVADRRPH